MLDKKYRELLKKAEVAASNAYAPYSKFRVGCAIETDLGVFVGFNIENSSSPVGICAERVAIANSLVAGASIINSIAIFCLDASEANNQYQTMPCGLCRQWFSELAPNAKVVTNGSERVFSVGELLPNAFSLI